MDLKSILKALKLNEGTISTVLGAAVVIVVGILVINYFKGLRESTPGQTDRTGQATQASLPTEHTVADNEHLWAISEKYYKSGYNWVDIAKANNLKNANRILVGQKLTIPDVEIRQPTSGIASGVSIESITGNSYNVVKGDHLWGIAVRAYSDGYQWVKIAKENNLKNPNIIEPGQVLTLPR